MRRRIEMSQVGETLDEVIKRLGLDAKISEQRAALIWEEIAGEQIARATEVSKVREGIMYVNCRNSTWANELLLHREELLKRIALRIGSGVIRDIRFLGRGFGPRKAAVEDRNEPEADGQIGPEERKEVERIASSAKDAELARMIRNALQTAKRRR